MFSIVFSSSMPSVFCHQWNICGHIYDTAVLFNAHFGRYIPPCWIFPSRILPAGCLAIYVEQIYLFCLLKYCNAGSIKLRERESARESIFLWNNYIESRDLAGSKSRESLGTLARSFSFLWRAFIRS